MAPWSIGLLDDGEPANWRVVWLGGGSAGSAYSAGMVPGLPLAPRLFSEVAMTC